MVVGETYTKRLWCVWELCTVFSFSSMQQALKTVVVQPMQNEFSEQEARKNFIQELMAFKYTDAKCYDPNEETRIYSAIAAVGGNRFNRRVHAMGQLMENSKKERSSTLASLTMSTKLAQTSIVVKPKLKVKDSKASIP